MRLLNVAAGFTNWNPVTDKIRTFVDSGVLITAARGSGESANDALAMLDDPDREFVSSFFIQLEVIPKPSYFNRESELSFYNNFFDAVAILGRSEGNPRRCLLDCLHIRTFGRGLTTCCRSFIGRHEGVCYH